MVDVVDPDGLVRSQAIEGRGGALRITLNGAESHRTFAGQGREICIVPVRKLVEILWVAGRAVAGAQQKQQQRRC